MKHPMIAGLAVLVTSLTGQGAKPKTGADTWYPRGRLIETCIRPGPTERFMVWNIIRAAILSMALSLPSLVYGASPDAPAELVTQYVTNPMAIDALPHFSWALRDIDRDERQTAYQIIVASTLAGINGNVGNIWDSGKTYSSKSTQVHYAGNPLVSDTRYWWKVRTWDKDGNASPWSAFASTDAWRETSSYTADAHLPTFGSDSIGVYEGKTPIWRRGAVARSIPGVSFKTTEPQRLVWQTGSGNYAFKVKLKDKANAEAN